MDENKKQTQSMVLCAFIFTAMFRFCFSSVKQFQNDTKMQTQSPNRIGSPFIFPVHGSVHLGFLYASVKIGNSPTPYFLDIDTGSDLTWVQCRIPDRPANLLPAPNHPYTPNNNLVYRHYRVGYGDGGSSRGVLVRDRFTFNEAAISPILTFGCGYDQHSGEHHQNVDGVLGLSNGKSSILSQLQINVIGHCFSRGGGGYLSFGYPAVPSRIDWTPVTPNSLNHYLSGPVDLLLREDTTVAEGIHITFDSGSTYSYLNSQTYRRTLSMIMRNRLEPAVDDVFLPVCWKVGRASPSIEDVRNHFRTLALRFTNNNVRFALLPEDYLIISPSGNVCLGILDGAKENLEPDQNIIGDISMLDKLVVYDNEKRRIGWASASCHRRP